MKNLLLVCVAFIILSCETTEPDLNQHHLINKNDVISLTDKLRFKPSIGPLARRNNTEFKKKDIKQIFEVLFWLNDFKAN